jgi:hypothetical protein
MSDHDPRYALPRSEHQQIFRQIVRNELAGVDGQADPWLVSVIGQTGAGKSVLADWISRHWPRGRGMPARIASDDYKPYDPMYAWLLKNDPLNAGVLTRVNVRPWRDLMEKEIRTERYDAVSEDSPANGESFAGFLSAFRDPGPTGRYRNEVAALAVPEAESLIAITQRFVQSGRFVAVDNHDKTFAGVPDTIGWIEDHRLAHAVAVVRRGGTVVHLDRVGPDGLTFEGPAGAGDAVVQERTRVRTEAEGLMLCHDLSDLSRRIASGAHPELDKMLDRIVDRARPILLPNAPLGAARAGREIATAGELTRLHSVVYTPAGPDSLWRPGVAERPAAARVTGGRPGRDGQRRR